MTYKPLPPLMQLIGSKTRQRKNILPILAKYPRTLYVEPFGGAGGLFFGKPPERAEVYNDANRAFVDLMRVVRNPQKLELLKRILDSTPMSRDLWYEARDISRAYMRSDSQLLHALKDRAGLTQYEDAVVGAFAIFYAQNCGFGGVFLRAFGGGGKGASASQIVHSYERRREILRLYMERLKSVSIERLDAVECVKKYDHESTLFYLDPPYITTAPHSDREEVAYGGNTINARALVECLKGIKGRFVLSCYDSPEYAELNEVADRFEFSAFSTVSQKSNRESGIFGRTEVVYASRLPAEPLGLIPSCNPTAKEAEPWEPTESRSRSITVTRDGCICYDSPDASRAAATARGVVPADG